MLLRPDVLESRAYQQNILKTARERNLLAVLPTGTGKTAIAILLVAERLERFPGSRALIMAPTRPLCAQHQKAFQAALELPEEDVILITGKIQPAARGRLYRTARVIASTPQCIQHDVITGILDLTDYSVLVVDECHRSVKRYAYPAVAKLYYESSKWPRILGLTASPGSSDAKIKEICANLFIEAVEIRTETDADIAPYIKHLNIDWVKVELPPRMREAQQQLKAVLKDLLTKLKTYNLYIRSKKDLLAAQARIQRELAANRNPVCYHILTQLAACLKVWHALELLETQSIAATQLYLAKLSSDRTRSAKQLLADRRIQSVMQTIEQLYNEGVEHPKMQVLVETVSRQLLDNPEIKLIVFSHYRDNIEMIYRLLSRVDGCRPAILIGQAGARGMSQKEQIDTIKDLDAGVYNCLITSPIGEEGLSIGSLDMAIFYDQVPSAIRRIQRRGRVARTRPGKLIVLLTKGTRDEVYHWKSQRDERRMKEILKELMGKSSSVARSESRAL